MAENRFNNPRGVTLFEIVIVAAISSMVLGMAMMIMNRTTRHFQRGTDMLNIQRLMDNIVENIRTDVRSLKRVTIPTKPDESSFEFIAIRDGGEKSVKYRYDSGSKTLFRSVEGKTRESNFHGSKQVESLAFFPEPDWEKLKKGEAFRYLNVVMRLKSDSKKDQKASTLSIICQFNSTCVEQELDIDKLSKIH